MKKILLATAIAATLAGTGLPAAADDVYVQVAPPPLRHEVVPSPRHGWAWAPGHWEWKGHRYHWAKGAWIRERVGYRYYEPRWIEHEGRWHMERGRWDRDHDGVPDRVDRDRDGDGVSNRHDRAPDNPRRH